MYRLIARRTIAQVLLIAFMFIFCGLTIFGAANALEPPTGGGTGTQVINTYETITISSSSFHDGSFNSYNYYEFDIYVIRPESTHLYMDEAEAIYLKPAASNTYFTSGYYLIDGYIDWYELQNKTSGIWLVDNFGVLMVYSFESINDFYGSRTTSLFNWTYSNVYTSLSAFSIRRVVYTDTSSWGYYSGYTKGGTSFDQMSFLFMDRAYNEQDGFGNYYIVTNGSGINLMQEYSIFGFIYKLTFNYLSSTQLNPATQNIQNTYFIDF